MSIILEQIIRQILLEQRTVAKIKQISSQEEALAKSKGAVQAYAVLVKGTNNAIEIPDLVLGATLASTGAETESVESVGARSKYATNQYVYVMSDPESLSKKRQRILVYILPNPFKNWKGRMEDNLPVALAQIGSIGNASLMTLNDYNTNLEITKSSNQKLNIDVTNEPDNPLKSEEQEFVYFPAGYTAKPLNGKEFKVYTLNDQDKYVYIIKDNSYQKTLKTDFEEKWANGIKITPEPVTDTDTIEKLNKITKQNIPVQSTEQPKKETKPEEPDQEEKKKETPKKPEEKKKEKPEEKKKERTFTVGETVTVKPKSAFYSWNSATNSFDKLGTTDAKIAMSGKYLGKSKSQGGKYIRVKFKEGEFWVNISSIK
jgi:hypothetical protein